MTTSRVCACVLVFSPHLDKVCDSSHRKKKIIKNKNKNNFMPHNLFLPLYHGGAFMLITQETEP